MNAISRTFRVVARIALGLGIALPLAALAQNAPASDDAGFAAWLEGVRSEGRASGLDPAKLDRALAQARLLPRVIELDRKQPEVTLTFEQYLDRVVTPTRIATGRRLLAENAALLDEVSARYRVQGRFIVALWGIETDYGRITGGFPVVSALATLAYDGRRSAYFRKELFEALYILDEGHIKLDAMMGSWAGAMGQSQFMPSSFRRHAVDHDGDGRKDIWTSRADVFASAANYLAAAGWRDDQTWGRRVRLPGGFDPALKDPEIRRPLDEWQALGVRRADGNDLPTRPLPASLVFPGGATGPAFLVYDNYRTVLKWNRSNYFAMAVGHLADAISR